MQRTNYTNVNTNYDLSAIPRYYEIITIINSVCVTTSLLQDYCFSTQVGIYNLNEKEDRKMFQLSVYISRIKMLCKTNLDINDQLTSHQQQTYIAHTVS